MTETATWRRFNQKRTGKEWITFLRKKAIRLRFLLTRKMYEDILAVYFDFFGGNGQKVIGIRNCTDLSRNGTIAQDEM
jgi:hypothetical protein